MARFFDLDDYFAVGAASPVEGETARAFERLLGVPPPKGYADVLARFGQCPFFGRLAVMKPDVILANQQSQREAADKLHMKGFFGATYAPNFSKLFTEEDGTQLVSIANSVDAEDLVLMPGLDEIFYFPSPRSGHPIQVAGVDVVAALDFYGHRRGFREPYFLGEGLVTTQHRLDRDHDWTAIFSEHTEPDRVDEDTWHFFYERASACVIVEDELLVVHTGRSHEAFRARLAELIASPPATA